MKLSDSSPITILGIFFDRPLFDGVVFKEVSPSQNEGLTLPFSYDKIKEVACSCDGNKSPRPVGFNFSFTKAYWQMLKGEVGCFF